jgi:hypothetical protein
MLQISSSSGNGTCGRWEPAWGGWKLAWGNGGALGRDRADARARRDTGPRVMAHEDEITRLLDEIAGLKARIAEPEAHVGLTEALATRLTRIPTQLDRMEASLSRIERRLGIPFRV